MAEGTALGVSARLLAARLKLPERIPDFGRRSLFLFQLLWFPAFLLAVVGPAAGTWYRASQPSQNSALVPGSRAGLALLERDLTRIRYAVGPAAARLGIRPGDDIVEIDGIRVSEVVPMPGTAAARAAPPNEVDEALFGELLYGTEDRDMLVRLRGADGRERDVQLRTGENHIEEGAAALGLPAWLLSFADLLHILTYPFLLISAWVLYRRKRFDVVSSVISLAILLTLATEQPSATFLAVMAGVPEWVHRGLYDVGNVCLLAGILLFPFGRLRPRLALLLVAALPLLLFLSGDVYRVVFMGFMAASVLTLVRRLKRTEQGDERQQLKWALFGFAGYALFLATSLVADMWKREAGGLSQQLALEVAAGFSFGLAFLLLQLGLLVALLRYRLYDAEAVISRSASLAIITVILGAAFAATMEAVKEVILAGFGRDAGSIAPVMGTAISTILVAPVYERVQRWTEQRFHRNLVALRNELPDCLRDLRHFASLPELVEETLARIAAGVRPQRIAFLAEGRLAGARGVEAEEVESWRAARAEVALPATIEFDSSDPLFPVRVPLRVEEGECLGLILVGPRPDRSSLSGAEREALSDIADPAARALRIVLKREARERELAATLARQQRQIDTLCARLSIDRQGTAA